MNACINCKHHRESRSGQHWCEHPNNGIDPIRGRPLTRLCMFSRSRMYAPCGPAGALFEEAPLPPPRLTSWQRVKALARRVWPW